jgi:hypothetical protein
MQLSSVGIPACRQAGVADKMFSIGVENENRVDKG